MIKELTKNKTYIFENYGCQMNTADSDEVKASLLDYGYHEVSTGTADLVILNSCAVRGTAEERIYSRLSHYAGMKKKEAFTLVLMGCVAQKDKEKVIKKIPEVDFVIGTHEKSRLTQIIHEHNEDQLKVYGDLGGYTFSDSVPSSKYPFKADMTVIHGCNKFCTYCIVPYTRGEEISRSSMDIINNAKALIDKGVTELLLLGQNVNSYGKDNFDISFSELLLQLNKLEGLKRIRFLTSHPIDFNFDLINIIRDCDKVCNYIHLPLQSASDRVLKYMKREYTFNHYMDIINELKKKVPDVVLSTDILVGFPYEEEEDFKLTLNAVKDIQFDTAYMFRYNTREGTEAANYIDPLSDEEKRRRVGLIIETQQAITKEKNQMDIGKVEEILLESKSKNKDNELLGKTAGNKPVVVEAEESEIGTYIQVKLMSLSGNTFISQRI